MARIKRFEEHRYVGTRDDMRVYDCDDPTEFATLNERVETEGLIEAKLLQAFAPDAPSEAHNRGYRPF